MSIDDRTKRETHQIRRGKSGDFVRRLFRCAVGWLTVKRPQNRATGDPPGNETPALAGHEHGGKKEKFNHQKTRNKAKPKLQGIRRNFFVCDGTALAGNIVESAGSRFKARNPAGETVGIFGLLKEALAALPRAGGDRA